LIAIVGFLLGLTALGAWYARRVPTAEDFALAGRRLGEAMSKLEPVMPALAANVPAMGIAAVFSQVRAPR